MLKPPPLFEVAGPPPPPAPSAAPSIEAQQSDDHWWTVANAIANALLDATSTAEIDRIRAENAQALADLKTHRRDLALTLSAGFQDRRRQLGGQQ